MMRAVVIIGCFLSIAFTSCKQEQIETAVYEGEFIFLTDAAVLKGDTHIYGVTIDEKMKELARTVKPLQRDEFDMVPVVIKGTARAKEKGTEGWDSIVTIKEIIQVKAPLKERPLQLKGGDKLNTEEASIKVESDTLSQN